MLGQPREGAKVLRASARPLGEEKQESVSSWADGTCPWVFLEITLQSLGEAWPYAPGVAKTHRDLETGPHPYSLAGQTCRVADTQDKAKMIRYLHFGSAFGAAGC